MAAYTTIGNSKYSYFLIGHINVNKGVFWLRISYLQINSYNVLNYNNCSTDWPFPLRDLTHDVLNGQKEIVSTINQNRQDFEGEISAIKGRILKIEDQVQ